MKPQKEYTPTPGSFGLIDLNVATVGTACLKGVEQSFGGVDGSRRVSAGGTCIRKGLTFSVEHLMWFGDGGGRDGIRRGAWRIGLASFTTFSQARAESSVSRSTPQ